MLPLGIIGCHIVRVPPSKIPSSPLDQASSRLAEHDGWFLHNLVTLKVGSQFPHRNEDGQRQHLNILIAPFDAYAHLDYEIHRFLLPVYFLDKD